MALQFQSTCCSISHSYHLCAGFYHLYHPLYHLFSRGYPKTFISPWCSYNFPWCPYFPLVFIRFAHGFHIFPSFSHRFPMVFLWFSPFSHRFLIIFLGFSPLNAPHGALALALAFGTSRSLDLERASPDIGKLGRHWWVFWGPGKSPCVVGNGSLTIGKWMEMAIQSVFSIEHDDLNQSYS